MREVTGPIIAIALVLCAVFVPTAFISGLTGQFYKQFALTIAISTVISAFNSLTLSPALSALLLQGPRRAEGPPHARHRIACSAGSSGPSTASSRALSHGYVRRRRRASLRAGGVVLVVYARPARRSPTWASSARRPASCRSRTSSIWSASRSCPTARDARSHRGGDPAHGRDRAEAAGRRERGGLPGPDHQRLHQQPQFRHRVRDPQALRGAQAERLSARRDRRRRSMQQYGKIQDAFIAIFPPPPVRAWAPSAASSCRSRTAAAWAPRRSTRQTDRPAWPRATRRPSSPASSPASRSTCRRSMPTSTARRPSPGRVASRTCSTPCRSTWARSTSTTSTRSAAPTR